MNRLAAYVLVIVFLSLGTGGLEYVHNLQHAAEDAREDAIAIASGKPIHEHHHDETNCTFHAQLHMPMVSVGWVPILISLGLLVAFFIDQVRPMIARRLPMRVDCRGPPVRSPGI